MYYRVRKSWEDSKSQLGAFTILPNAIKKCDANPGYCVFDEKGNVIHRSGKNDVVRTMGYKAKVLKAFGSYKKGKEIVVTINRKKKWVVVENNTVVPARNYIDLKTQNYDPKCEYSKEIAEKWVNDEGFTSSTDWLFWANKYGQRAYIFKGKKGKWVLEKTYKCGTGSIKDGDLSDPGVYFGAKIYNKQKEFKGPRGTQYWNMHYSSAGGNSIHVGTVGKPSTHGCIALASSAAKWAFVNLPINTRVILY